MLLSLESHFLIIMLRRKRFLIAFVSFFSIIFIPILSESQEHDFEGVKFAALGTKLFGSSSVALVAEEDGFVAFEVPSIRGHSLTSLAIERVLIMAGAQYPIIGSRVDLRIKSILIKFKNGHHKVLPIDGWIMGDDGIRGLRGDFGMVQWVISHCQNDGSRQCSGSTPSLLLSRAPVSLPIMTAIILNLNESDLDLVTKSFS